MPRSLMRMFPVLLLPALALALSEGALPAAAQDTYSISGTVYFDTDMDGERDPDEPPAPGRTVEVGEGETGDLLGTMESAADGSYRFIGLSPERSYFVSVRTDSETPCVTSGSYETLLDQAWTDIDLGVLDAGTGRVSGALINDLNENGVPDPDEPGIEGWLVAVATGINDGMGSCGLSALSDSKGGFEFSGLPPFAYEIDFQSPPSPPSIPAPAWEVTFPVERAPESPFPDARAWDWKVNLTQAGEALDLKLGVHFLTGTGAIAGSVFRDLDLDEARDEGEPLLDCTLAQFFVSFARVVPSIGALGVIPGDLSCQDGQFQLGGLPPGTYRVSFLAWCAPPDQMGPPSDPDVPPHRLVTLKEGERVGGVGLGICPGIEDDTPPAPLPSATPLMVAPSVDWGPVGSDTLAPPSTGSGGASSDSGLAGFAAALAVAGTLAASASALAIRRKGHLRR